MKISKCVRNKFLSDRTPNFQVVVGKSKNKFKSKQDIKSEIKSCRICSNSLHGFAR